MNTNNPSQNKFKNLNQAVYLLCRYATAQTDDSFAKQAVSTIFQLAILDMGRGRHPLRNLREAIVSKFHLDFEEYEIEKIIEELAEDDILQYHEDDEEISLTRKARRKLNKLLSRGSSFQRFIFKEWGGEIQSKYPQISSEGVELLLEDLKIFLTRLAIMWSEEFLSSIYPDEFTADGRLDDAISDSLDELEFRDVSTNAIREKEFPSFVFHASQDRRVYLANLLDSAMVICALTIDPNSSKLIDQRISNIVLYADTNFLIFLLGLSDPNTMSHVKRLVELTIEAGAKVLVSQYTLRELREVISKNRDFIIDHPNKARFEAKDRLSKGRYNLTTAYILRCEELGVALSPHDYYNPFLYDLESRLASFGIIIEDEETVFSPSESELEKETEYLLNSTKHYGKRVELAKHDAYHKLLIEHLRKDKPELGGIGRYWFLTCDFRLPIYALQRSDSLHMPFCILSSAWLAFLRTMHPRTNDFALATSELLFQPALGLYDDIASELLKITRAKYKHISDFSLEVQTSLPISRLLENVIASTIKDKDELEEFEYDQTWEEEIAAPAAAGLLTEELRFKEAVISQNREINRRFELLSNYYLSISARAKHLEKVVIALAVWGLMIVTITIVNSFLQFQINFFFFALVVSSLVPLISLVSWKKKTANQILVFALGIFFVFSLSTLLIMPVDIVWKMFLGLSTIAGFIRAIGQLIRWYKE